MELLQNIDPSQLPFIAVGCALLCVAVIVIGLLLQAVSGIFDVVFGLIEVVTGILQGGPIAWCGCGLLICGLVACAGVTFLLLNAAESCAAHPTNFCRWLGFLP